MGKVVKRKAIGAAIGGGKAVKKLIEKRKGRVQVERHVQQRSERGEGLKFKLETFATISSFSPGTRIEYMPNPKTPGSKSHTRYARYMKAKTVGESLKLGSKKADFFWELERGYYKVLGSARSEAQEVAAIGKLAYDKAKAALASFVGPRGLPMKNFDDPKAAEELKQEEAWRERKLKRCEALAEQMGLKVESVEEIEAFGESRDIRLQRRVASALCERKLKEADKAGKKITDADVSEVLHCWGFAENNNRLNVLPSGRKYVYSDTVGAIRRRTGVFGVTPSTSKYPDFAKLLCRWLSDNRPSKKYKFLCTAINLNANYAGRRHRDANNEGPSVIRAFGKFKGGRLHYWPKDTTKPKPQVEALRREDSVTYDIAKETFVFNGNCAHEVEPFKGERYSVVFFTAGGYRKSTAATTNFLKKVGFPWPTPGGLAELKRAATGP